jgi:hypothetical protein
MPVLLALIFLGYVAMRKMPLAWCRIGWHEWDQPGGHCVDCSKCDEFLGPHTDCPYVRWGRKR